MKLAWRQICAALLAGVLCGVAIGWWTAPWYLRRQWAGMHGQQRLLERFSSALKLTPQQRERIAAILDDKRQKFDALRGETRSKFEALRQSTSADIRQLLTPEQQQKFDVLHTEWEARHKRWRMGWPGP